MTYTEEQAHTVGEALALITWQPGRDPEWTHVRWQEPDGELMGDPPTMSYSGDTWVTTAGDPVEIGDVIEWAPLPLRGVSAVYPEVIRVSRYLVTDDGDAVFSCCHLGDFETPLCAKLDQTKRYQMHITFVEIEE